MAVVPIGLNSYKRTLANQPETRLVNMVLEEDATGGSPDKVIRVQRPGLAPHQTLAAPVRAMLRIDGVAGGLPVAVAGTSVYKFNGSTATLLGAVADDGDTAVMRATFERIGIVSGGNFYTSNGSSVVQVAMPDAQAVIDVEVINGYFLLSTASGKFYWLVPGKPSINGLDFATAESSPDGLVCIKRLNDELYFLGKSTVEIWQTTGNADAPFQRAAGRLFDKGCLSRDTAMKFDNSIVWVGNDNIVYRMNDVPKRISTNAIEESLRKRTGVPSAFQFAWDGHVLYVLRIPGQGTFAYDASSGAWSEFSTYGESVWRPRIGVDLADGTWLCSDSSTGVVWKLDPSRANDAGTPVERIVTGLAPITGKPVRNDSFTVHVGVSADATIRFRWADGALAVSGDYEERQAFAPMDLVSLYRLGIARQTCRLFEISCLDDVLLRITGAVANEAWDAVEARDPS